MSVILTRHISANKSVKLWHALHGNGTCLCWKTLTNTCQPAVREIDEILFVMNAKKRVGRNEFVRFVLWIYRTEIRFLDLQSMPLLGSDSVCKKFLYVFWK